jgi:hypothetical protein
MDGFSASIRFLMDSCCFSAPISLQFQDNKFISLLIGFNKFQRHCARSAVNPRSYLYWQLLLTFLCLFFTQVSFELCHSLLSLLVG